MKAIAKTKMKKPLPQFVFMPSTLPSTYIHIYICVCKIYIYLCIYYVHACIHVFNIKHQFIL